MKGDSKTIIYAKYIILRDDPEESRGDIKISYNNTFLLTLKEYYNSIYLMIQINNRDYILFTNEVDRLIFMPSYGVGICTRLIGCSTTCWRKTCPINANPKYQERVIEDLVKLKKSIATKHEYIYICDASNKSYLTQARNYFKTFFKFEKIPYISPSIKYRNSQVNNSHTLSRRTNISRASHKPPQASYKPPHISHKLQPPYNSPQTQHKLPQVEYYKKKNNNRIKEEHKDMRVVRAREVSRDNNRRHDNNTSQKDNTHQTKRYRSPSPIVRRNQIHNNTPAKKQRYTKHDTRDKYITQYSHKYDKYEKDIDIISPLMLPEPRVRSSLTPRNSNINTPTTHTTNPQGSIYRNPSEVYESRKYHESPESHASYKSEDFTKPYSSYKFIPSPIRTLDHTTATTTEKATTETMAATTETTTTINNNEETFERKYEKLKKELAGITVSMASIITTLNSSIEKFNSIQKPQVHTNSIGDASKTPV